MMYQCCIFDLDGTLVNSINALTYTTNLTLQTYGLKPIEEAQVKKFVGDGYRKLIERALLHCGDLHLEYYENALVTYMDFFERYCMYRVEPYEGIRELLEFLKKKQIKIAVLSNKPHARTLDNVEGIFGCQYFDIISGEKEQIPRKPDPAGALLTAKELGLKPEDCLYFGDTNTDMETGKAARMDTVGVTWGFREREELEAYRPKYLVDHPKEVIELLKNLL